MANDAVTVIRAGRLIDGSGEAPLDDAVIVVKGSTIDSVSQGDVAEALLDRAERVVDRRDCTVLPGLIDMHAHLNLSAGRIPPEQWALEPEGVLMVHAAAAAQTALDAGITTIRDCGSHGHTMFNLRRAFDLGVSRGPRLVLAGPPLTITGGHGWSFGGEADGPEGLRHKVRSVVKSGADFIKVMGSGGGTANTIAWAPSLRPEEFAAVVDEAHRLGRRITFHSTNAAAIDAAIAAGADQIEHGWFMIDDYGHQQFDPAVADKLAAADVAVTPTLSVAGFCVESIQNKENRTPEEEEFLRRWSMILEANLDNLGRLHQAGVRIVAGSDSGWRQTPFDGLIEELALMCRSGMSAMASILAATSHAAAAMGQEEEYGSIKPGLEADLIAVDSDPLADIKALRHPRLVMKSGRMHRDS